MNSVAKFSDENWNYLVRNVAPATQYSVISRNERINGRSAWNDKDRYRVSCQLRITVRVVAVRQWNDFKRRARLKIIFPG